MTIDRIEDWIFDLDNTLYPASKSLFPQIDQRMKRFIATLMDLSLSDAHILQKQYYRDYGTTLRGLMTVHGIAPESFLDFVHDIDHSVLAPAPRLDRALGTLPGRKIVFTNGSQAHAEKVLNALGIAARFDAVFDIKDADYLPKPDPRAYDILVKRFGVARERAVMVEDLARNLEPAARLGMTTVLVHQDDHPDTPHLGDTSLAALSALAHIHHIVPDLEDWLEQIQG